MTRSHDLKPSPKIVVFGKGGQIASALEGLLPLGTLFPSIEEANFTQTEKTLSYLNDKKPSLVINCAAYTAVDLAESNEPECLLVNATTPVAIAQWCAKNSAILVHFSTDYVFSSNQDDPLVESDPPDPKSVYGRSKLLGDLGISDSGCKYINLRISWVYSSIGKNFVLTMLKLASDKSELRIVDDQVGYPTLAKDVAKAVIQILPKIQSGVFEGWGVYHLTGPDVVTWFGFAQLIFEQARSFGAKLKVSKILPIATSEYPTPAKRPLNSRLNSTKFLQTFGFQLPSWKVSLNQCLTEIYANR